MPEVLFTIELPDGATKECYSPSTVVRDYFAAGDEMPLAEFVDKGRRALAEASERVRAKYGFSCSSASAQLDEIARIPAAYPGGGTVRIVQI